MEYLLFAILIDLIVGDPKLIPHPVVIIGTVIDKLESGIRKISENSKIGQFIGGLLLVALIVSGTYIITIYLVEVGYQINKQLGMLLHIWLISSTIAIKGLKKIGVEIKKHLDDNSLENARSAVDQVVGRDTDKMEGRDIIRAVVETIAENTSDGIIAPIFYYFLGGLPLAMTYKAVNTLDSMLGYNNKRYKYIGKAAARLDDLANIIPARITGLGFCLAALLIGYDWKNCLKVMYKDAPDHPSWNAGYPEAAIAGALNVRLGGLNYYNGRESFRAYMGERKNDLTISHIDKVIKMVYLNLVIFICGKLLIQVFI